MSLQLLDNLRVLIRPHQLIIGQRINDRLTKVCVVLEPNEVKYLWCHLDWF